MKYILLLVLFVTPTLVHAQKDSLTYYINRLNWESFEISSNYIPIMVMKHDAQRLIALEDKNKTKKLIHYLLNESSTVASHIILTAILEPEKNSFAQIYRYGSDSTVVGIQYSFNGLVWNWSEQSGNQIKKNDMIVIRKYWKKKVECH